MTAKAARTNRVTRAAVLGLVLLAAAPAQAAWDPLEAVNRRVHAANAVVQARVLAPAADLYLSTTSPGFRRGVGNVLGTLAEPVTAVSALAAWDLDAAGNAAARFSINATLGWGGVRDRAAEWGWAPRPVTPGDALCRWGVPAGPYLVLPLLGPATLRDAAARAATGAALSGALGGDVVAAWGAADGFHFYAGLYREAARVEAGSLDPYAVLRSAHAQRRAAACAVDRAAEDADE